MRRSRTRQCGVAVWKRSLSVFPRKIKSTKAQHWRQTLQTARRREEILTLPPQFRKHYKNWRSLVAPTKNFTWTSWGWTPPLQMSPQPRFDPPSFTQTGQYIFHTSGALKPSFPHLAISAKSERSLVATVVCLRGKSVGLLVLLSWSGRKRVRADGIVRGEDRPS